MKVLVDQVPDRRAQFRRVLDSDILPQLDKLRSELKKIDTDSHQSWKNLHDHGLTEEALRLKYDEMEDAAHRLKTFTP